MKKLLFSTLSAAVLGTSCNAVYKSQQTPDDLYYSTGKEVSAAEQRRYEKQAEEYQEYVSTVDDNYLRMKVSNPRMWGSIDNFAYWNDMRYGFTPSLGYSNWGFYDPWGVRNPWSIGWYNGWNLGLGVSAWNTWCPSPWYSPGFNNSLYTVIGYANPKVLTPGTNGGANLSAYKNRLYNNTNQSFTNGKDSWYAPGKQGGDNNNLGNLVRRVFSNSGNGNSSYPSTYDRGARTFSNSGPAPSSNAGGSSGGFKSSGSSASSGRGGRN